MPTHASLTRKPPLLALTLACAMACGVAAAQSEPAAPATTDSVDESATASGAEDGSSAGLLPIPDYTSDVMTRAALLGDLSGSRTALAQQGIQFGINWSQTMQSVIDGGRDVNTAYGGTLDYDLSIDLMRMGLVPGGLVKLRGESRYGDSVNGDTGSLLPANSDFFFPLTDKIDESVPMYLTTLSYTQFFSESFAVFVGKFDTLDGDPNEFASGRGLTQFQNLNFQFTPAPLLIVPYSTLGAGIVFKPTPDITLSSSVITTADASSTTGFDNIGDGWTWTAEAQVQYRLGRLPGGFNLGGAYAWDNEFTTIDRRFVFQPGEGIIRAPDQNSSWAAYCSMWQYLHVKHAEGAPTGPLDLANRRPDLPGFGVFARVGIADDETNPTELAISAGLGGRGILPGRDDDIFGIGYFRNEFQTGRIAGILGAQEYYQGIEAFYNFAITPSIGLTLDFQAIEPVSDSIDTALVLGMRLVVQF